MILNGKGDKMKVKDLILEMTGLELHNYLADLGIDRTCLEREIVVEVNYEFGGNNHCEITEVNYNGEIDQVIIKVEN